MSSSNNLKLVNHYFMDILCQGKHELIDEIIHPAYIPFHGTKDPKPVDLDSMKEELMKITGIEGIKSRIKLFAEQFGDIDIDMMEVVETKETVVVHYKVTMKHIGKWNEIPATGLEITTQGFHLFKFRDKKIFSISGMMNLGDILTQLGRVGTDKKSSVEYLDNIKKLLKL